MGKSDNQLFLQITDMNTGNKYMERLNNPLVNYNIILTAIESYIPEIDPDTVTIYYFKERKWQLFLEDDVQDMQFSSKQYYADNESNDLVMKVRYHCQYFLENEQEEMIRQDIDNMNKKVEVVQGLYQDLKEKYMQDALDINIFYASPIWTKDEIVRSKKGIQYFQNLKGQKVQLLNNQLKSTPYINAITAALENCKKKVDLYLKPFNENSFKKKTVFTITYIMAHLEIEEIKEEKNKEKSKEYKKNQHLKQTQEINMKTPLKKIESEYPKENLWMPIPPKIEKDSFKDGPDSTTKIVLEETDFKPESTHTLPDAESNTMPNDFKMIHSKSAAKYKENQGEQLEVDFGPDQAEIIEGINEDSSQQDKSLALKSEYSSKNQRKYKKQFLKEKPKFNYYFLGEHNNGQLIKITPEQLTKMFENNDKMTDIQLLILHTSYPYHHLDVLKKKAKNIILINSNPLYPQPSTIFFVKQFFILLLKTGNIAWAYKQAIAYTLSLKHPEAYKQLCQKQIEFINQTNQRYVHGSIQCCCCYHPHRQNCQSQENSLPTKYAQYHYKFHSINCQCPRENLMMHRCEQKNAIMKKNFQVLDKKIAFDEYYFCCCCGSDLGYYKFSKKNQRLLRKSPINEEKDPHGIMYKYKYEQKMANEEDNQLEIHDGKVQGYISKNLLDALTFKEENGLIGNGAVIANLLQLFAGGITDRSLICNLYGSKRSGRKTIAIHFANLLIIKQIFHRMVVKNINSIENVSGIVKKEMEKSKEEGLPFFIFFFDRPVQENMKLSQDTFSQHACAIIITEQKIQPESNFSISYLEPMPFKVEHCQSYVKMYKHLTRVGKRNLQTLFRLAGKGHDKAQSPQLYPCSLNEFQILTMLWKTNFHDYQKFEKALGKLSKDHIQYYVFLVSLIKFTTSPRGLKEETVERMKEQAQNLSEKKVLFFKDYDNPSERKHQIKTQSDFSSVSQDTSYNTLDYLQELLNFDRLREHYYLIYACAGYKFKNKLTQILKMFINYSTLIPYHKFKEDIGLKRQINFLQAKNSPLSEQIYEATSVNRNSYIGRYFKEEIENISKEYTIHQDNSEDHKELKNLEIYLKDHSNNFKKRKIPKKKSFEVYSKPKDKQRRIDFHNSPSQASRDSKEKIPSIHSGEFEDNFDQCPDVQNIHYLASIIEAGLQFMRTIIGNHFIYNRLKEPQKIEVLKHCLLLLNNCVILMKNKTFMKINGKFDLDYQHQTLHRQQARTKILAQHTRSLMEPQLAEMRSQDLEIVPETTTRTFSGRELFNSTREYPLFEPAIQSNKSDKEQRKSSSEKANELLIKELYRLSTYKGVLYLLSQLERRCTEINNDSIFKVKIATQLLGIQVRLEQLQIEEEQSRLIFSEKDRHLTHISEVFNEKNYNIITIKKILREEVSSGKYYPAIEELGIIKSHIIVALALMSSCYGRFKLVRGNFMIEEIQTFLNEWNLGMPLLQRKQSQQDGTTMDREKLLKIWKCNQFFSFMLLMSENQSVYLRITQSFNSLTFWSENRGNEQLKIYMEMVKLYHLFALKNTKKKEDFYNKLELIEQKLMELKKIKHFAFFSTYIHNFWNSLAASIKYEMNKLGEHLILILTTDSESSQNDIKISLGQKIADLIAQFKEKPKQSHYFCLRKRFSLANLQRLSQGYRCNYLCLYFSTSRVDQTKIGVETETGKSYNSQDLVVNLLKKAQYKLAFLCFPKQKVLASQLIAANRSKRIIYFNFQYNHFNFKDQGKQDDLLIFQKMIMITTVSKIIRKIIEKEQQSNTIVYDAFCQIGNNFQFKFVTPQNTSLIQLVNSNFKKCLFMHGIENQNWQRQCPNPKSIKLNQSEKIQSRHLAAVDKFLKMRSESKEIKIEIPIPKRQFFQVFKFSFSEKYDFQNIFMINLEDFYRQLNKMKRFYEKLIEEKILEAIFSNKKVILVIEFKEYDAFAKECENVFENMMMGFNEQHSACFRRKFIGQVRQQRPSVQALIYFFDYPERQQFVKLQSAYEYIPKE